MKKLLFLIPFLLPAISNAQCVASGGSCGPSTTPQSAAFIVFGIAVIIFIVYLSHFSKKVAIKEMLKSFIDKEVIVISLLAASFFVWFSFAVGNISIDVSSQFALAMGSYNLEVFNGFDFLIGKILLIMIPPFYFVFTRGWRHFLACFADTVILIFLLSVFIIKM